MSTDNPGVRRNKPTQRGRELGKLVGAITDRAEPKVRAKFPEHAERCKSCAFTAGTFPNGCEETLMDAIKCVVDGEPFFCHQHFDEQGAPTELCAGWLIATTDIDDRRRKAMKAITDEWKYSHEN